MPITTVSGQPDAPAIAPAVEGAAPGRPDPLPAEAEPAEAEPAEDALPLGQVQPWICRESIAPRVWSEDDRTALWMESNGSEGCYGGWELLFPVGAQLDDVLLLELAAEATGLERGTDELVVEAFWYDDSGAEVNWDPVLLDRVTGDEDGRLSVYYAKSLRYPAGATQLGVRCGLRWSPRGRVRWHGWRLQRTAPRPPRTLRLGVASGRPRKWVSATASIAHYVEQCRQAGAARIDLVCLPETILSAGSPDHSPEAVHAQAVPVPGPWLEAFREVARAYRMGICFSVLERAGTRDELVYNTALLLGRDGELIGTYRKVHLALMEARQGVAAGHEFPVYAFDGVTVGMGICMDSSAAETCRILAQRGAEIMLMPIMGDFRASRWVHGGREFDTERWKLVQRSHAFDNHLYVVACRNANFGSAITAPWGEIIAYNDGDRDLIWADVHLDRLRSHPLGASIQAVLASMRRPHVYGSLADTNHPVGSPNQRGRRG